MTTTVKVWDPIVRTLHWSLAIGFLANFMNEGGDPLHNWIGYAALLVIAVRFLGLGRPATRPLQRLGPRSTSGEPLSA